MPIVVDFENLRADKNLTVAQLATLIGISQANLFVLKNNRGKAIRFSTLEALCSVLDCQPGDILRYEPTKPVKKGPKKK
jgi:putative transcriptional regulator